jgi:hypothetical protein
MFRHLRLVYAATCVLALLVGCAGASDTRPPHLSDCSATSQHRFICGAGKPEDLARIPGTRWLIASGFQSGSGLKLVDTRSRTLSRWYSGSADQLQPDRTRFANCPGPLDAKIFNAQGITLRSQSATEHTLYVANHGGRESIEVFAVDSGGTTPALHWIGCVVMPGATPVNSVATFSDGTILASVLTRPGTTITDFVKGRVTGGVYRWRPGDPSFALLPGTELPGNNGIETSRDDREFYVVAFAWRSILIYSRDDTTHPVRQVVAPGFMPDNLHWDGDRLILAGMTHDEPACGGTRGLIDGEADPMRCHRGYVVAALDPSSLQFRVVAYSEPDPIFNGVSAARIVDNELWLGSYQSDRIAYRMLSWLERRGGRE